jgi:DNA helicase-2/ATP-dependent DNA helicase PcrA
MTRAEKRLYLTWAKSRRKYGGGAPEPCIPSRFLAEVPRPLTDKLREDMGIPQVSLHAERSFVRESAKRNLYTGKTYNSLENISQFFSERGVKLPAGAPAPPRAPVAHQAPKPPVQPVQKPSVQPVQKPPVQKTGQSGFDFAPPPVPIPAASVPPRPPAVSTPQYRAPVAAAKKKPFGYGSTIHHPKYGRGTVLRREGEGDDAKLTVSFPGHGLKKLIEKYAGLKVEE